MTAATGTLLKSILWIPTKHQHVDQSRQKQSSRRITAFYVCLFRSCFVLILMMYLPIATFYLTTGYSKSSPTKHILPHPHSTMNDRHVLVSEENDPMPNTFQNAPKDVGINKTSKNDIVYQKLRDAGVSEIYLQQIQWKLPKWDDIVQQYGSQPIIHNLDTSCSMYQALVPPQKRVLGAAGMFNTGTNLVTQLLKQNCYIPERAATLGIMNATKEQLGIRWQVPWGKHTPAHYKYSHAASDKAATIRVEDVLPIITIRHPYRWIQSMCHHPYSAKWDHYKQCPNVLKRRQIKEGFLTDHKSNNETRYNQVTVQYGAGTETYASIPHLWNDWYNQYYQHSIHRDKNVHNINSSDKNDQATTYYPLLITRMEDLIFHTKDTITSICHCAGGQLYDSNNFKYIVTSAKGDSPGHDTTTNIVNAYLKYGVPMQRGAGLEYNDYNLTRQILNNDLMNMFHYYHPAPQLLIH